jgi:cytochrome c biogenesis protein CcmG/thiol:disulfide interchange protein DsbE
MTGRRLAIRAMAKKSFTVVLLCLLPACGHGTASQSAPAQSASVAVGKMAPNWDEKSLPGPTLALASLRGKAVYLNFFATWCPPCNQEASAIDALQRRYGARGLQVVGVDVLEDARKAAQFRAEHHVSYPVVVDAGVLRDQYKVNGLPVHVFIDRTGVVRTIAVGELSAADMRRNVERILR